MLINEVLVHDCMLEYFWNRNRYQCLPFTLVDHVHWGHSHCKIWNLTGHELTWWRPKWIANKQYMQTNNCSFMFTPVLWYPNNFGCRKMQMNLIFSKEWAYEVHTGKLRFNLNTNDDSFTATIFSPNVTNHNLSKDFTISSTCF